MGMFHLLKIRTSIDIFKNEKCKVTFGLEYIYIYSSLVMRKPAFCICENKDTEQLRSNCAADQRLCFRYTDSTIPLLPTSENSSL